MTQGLSREQIGMTDAMVRVYGEVVFRLSNNLQRRRGDPVREGDLEAVERQRPELGMSDAQIAAQIGLSPAQVTYIRNRVEVERMETNNFQRLLALGGGRRFRAERFTPHRQRPGYSERALALRAAMSFDPGTALSFLENGWWGNDTLRSWLSHWAAETPARAALVSPAGAVSYAELLDRVQRVARALADLGVGRGEVVAVQLPNVPEYLVAYLAITYIGAVMTTLYLPHRAAEMKGILSHSRARALICVDAVGGFSPARTALDLNAEGALTELDHVVVLGEPIAGCISFSALERTDDPRPDAMAAPVAADPMLLLFTSGTTAGPKAVPHNAHTLLSNTRLGVPEHGVSGEDLFLCAAPFGHLFGQYSLHLAWCTGAAHLLLPAFTPPALAELIATGRPSVLFAAPAQLTACASLGLLDAHDIGSLRLAVTAGSAVPPATVETLAARMPGGTVCQLWGMTETQAGSYTRPSDPPDVAARSAGRASPGTELRVAARDAGAGWQVLPAGAEGELHVRGPLLFPGYLDNPDATARGFTADGWFITGDLAVLDQAGNVTITGRVKDLINRGGIKYNPLDVETLIDRHPAIQLCAIVPMPDPVLGERACCFAVLAPGASMDLETLCAYLLEHGIAKLKLPERLVVLDELPLTPTRKVIKGRLEIPA